MTIAHAEHNEELCEKLHDEGKWNDWVVTTAFYSAIHYVEAKLFPLKAGDTEYKDFNDFYAQCPKTSGNRHKTRIALVGVHIHKAHSAYRWLHDACSTARYSDYNTSPVLANKALTCLRVVKSLCTSSTSKPKATPPSSPATGS